MRLLITLTLLIISSVFAQNRTVKGLVYNAQSKAPLQGVNIVIKNSNLGTASDKDGYFSLNIKTRNTPTLIFSHIGFKTVTYTLKATQDKIEIAMQPIYLNEDEIIVSDTRAVVHQTPITFTNKTHDEIKNSYGASDVPMLINDLPNTFAYSQSGDEIGYSFIKIRGFDQKRINVMVNDVPLNDPEDQQVYWVDMPDLAENIEDIQVQRGAGTANYGTSSFGGSININSAPQPRERTISAQYGMGSFGLKKFALQFNTGMVADKYSFYSRYSQLSNDGFRDNSDSKLRSYYFSGVRYDKDMITRLNIFGGHEVTKPDWYGIPQNILEKDRTYNQANYKREVDDFLQTHYQLSNEWKLNKQLSLKNTAYMVHGKGYYEGLKNAKKLTDFGMNSFTTNDANLFGADSLTYYENNDTSLTINNGKYTVKRTDLVRQKHVDKTQLGFISRAQISSEEGSLTFGFSGYTFKSDHWGKVLWAKNMPAQYSPNRSYYSYNGNRKQFALFANSTNKISEDIIFLGNIMYEYKLAEFKQNRMALFQGGNLNSYSVTYNLLNTKMGLNYRINKQTSVYGNISFAQREPTDGELFNTWEGPDDLGAAPLFKKVKVKSDGSKQWSDPYTKPESVVDYELGLYYQNGGIKGSLNFYYMDFSNEIVSEGGLNNDGQPIKTNADKTIHRGVEATLNYALNSNIGLSANAAYSQNFYDKFISKTWSGEVDLSGNEIAGFPNTIANIKLYSSFKGLFTSLSMQYVGKQYLDNTENEDRTIDPFYTVNLFSSYTLKTELTGLPEMRILAKINNLLNAEYETAGYYDAWANTAFYWPASGRNFYLSLEVKI